MKSEVRATLIAAAVVVALYLLGALFPGSLNCGFHFLGFLSWQYSVLYVAVAIWIAVFVVTGSQEELIGRIAGIFTASPLKFLGGTVVTLVAFGILLRVQAPLLGDSFYLLKNYLESSRGTSPLFPRDEPLATYYFSSLLSILGATTFKGYLRAFLAADLLLGRVRAECHGYRPESFRATTHQFLCLCFYRLLNHSSSRLLKHIRSSILRASSISYLPRIFFALLRRPFFLWFFHIISAVCSSDLCCMQHTTHGERGK